MTPDEFVLLYDDGRIYLFCTKCREDEFTTTADDTVATLAGAIAAANAHECVERDDHP